MLTKLEAEDRAKRIWQNYVSVTPSLPVGGASDEWYVLTGDSKLHELDGNGHTKCHEACAKLEEKV